jgi:adenine-specific DNA-methyltransferase
MDYFYFFFHFALNINKDNGITAFISTNYYPTARGARKLRKDFKSRTSVVELVNFNELKIFESAKGQHNMITLLQKENNENTIAKTSITQRIGVAKHEVLQDILNGVDQDTLYSEIKQKDLYDGDETYIRFTGTNNDSVNPANRILSKIQDNNELLGSLCHVNVGLYTGADKITESYIEKYKLNNKKGEGIFVINTDELENLTLNSFEKSRIVPFYKNSDIDRWYTKNKADLFLINLSYPDVKSINLDDIPNLYKRLSSYEKVLKGRKSNDNGLRSVIKSGYWWAFTIRQLDFTQPKIVSPQRSSRNTFGWNENPWYASADVYFITEKNKQISLKYILSLLNSKLYYFWLYNRGKRKGESLELYQKPLSEIPIKNITPGEQEPFIQIVNKILTLTRSNDYLDSSNKQAQVKDYEKEINQMVYELYDIKPDEVNIIEGITND